MPDTYIAHSFADAISHAGCGRAFVILHALDDDQAREFAGKLRQRLGLRWRDLVHIKTSPDPRRDWT